MNEKLATQLHNAKCRELVLLMRQVGQLWNEEEEFLEDYIADQLKYWTNSSERLQSALECFQELKEQGNGYGKKRLEPARK